MKKALCVAAFASLITGGNAVAQETVPRPAPDSTTTNGSWVCIVFFTCTQVPEETVEDLDPK